MKTEEKCINCGVKIIFEKKDIKPIPKFKKKEIEENNDTIRKKLKAVKETGIIFKKKEYVVSYLPLRELMESLIITPYGFIKCPICNNKQMLIHKGEKNENL